MGERSTTNSATAFRGRVGISPVSRFCLAKYYITLRLCGTCKQGKERIRYIGISSCCAKPRLLLAVRTAKLQPPASIRLRIAPLFVHCNLRRSVDSGDLSRVVVIRSNVQLRISDHRLLWMLSEVVLCLGLTMYCFI